VFGFTRSVRYPVKQQVTGLEGHQRLLAGSVQVCSPHSCHFRSKLKRLRVTRGVGAIRRATDSGVRQRERAQLWTRSLGSFCNFKLWYLRLFPLGWALLDPLRKTPEGWACLLALGDQYHVLARLPLLVYGYNCLLLGNKKSLLGRFGALP